MGLDKVSVYRTEGAANARAPGGVKSCSVDQQSIKAQQIRSTISVRLPRDTDWNSLLTLVRKIHSRSFFRDAPFSDQKYALIEAEARNPKAHQCLLVAEADGNVVGLAWFSAGEYLLGEGTIITTAHLIGVDTEYCGPYRAAKVFTKLMRGIAAWSRTRRSHQILVHVSTGYSLKQTDRLLRAGGGVCIGGNYAVPL